MHHGNSFAGQQYAPAQLGAIPAPAETLIFGELSSLEAHLTDLGAACDLLSLRLANSVLRPDNVQPISTGSNQATVATAAVSPMFDRIASIRNRVQNITAHVQNTLDRLEA